ncbi:MAG: hypothetical protein QNJ57_11490 [Flavobacteriaceae bacterium]|nr:hypothetical protein [Flavobacteriaceae bacterium]
MGFILFAIAVLLSVLTVPFGMLYTVLKLVFRLKFGVLFRVSDGYFYMFALAIDQMGNVAMQDLFNDLLITKDGYKFGDVDETISSVLGKNEETDTLSGFGKIIVKFLNFIDPNHALNSIERYP